LLSGDFPPLSVIAVGNGTVRASVSEVTKGQPDGSTVALTLEGAVSLPFKAVGATLSTAS